MAGVMAEAWGPPYVRALLHHAATNAETRMHEMFYGLSSRVTRATEEEENPPIVVWSR
jgi:hypothetical protein